MPIHHPPIPILQRKKITEAKGIDDNLNTFFTLKRSGRVVRCVDGAPPIALRDWQPVKIKDDIASHNPKVQELIQAELIHILKPIVHLAAMRVFGTQSWKQWLIALGMDPYVQRLFKESDRGSITECCKFNTADVIC
ncbi:hypothetical protein KGM_203964 [Danaus plexippus plexippus]|uniref:Peroxisomal membrane protein PEX16 n=1 Tax=Danaus plexippus plexippus TaxID=278856 RepID=A0A212F9L2_DANPL|nr:hypothetical protein KGM_203964 [Danaus plexippus plexippus]